MNFVHTDNLGSFDVITNATGTVLQRNSFDAWGRRRNPTNWTYTGVPTTFLFDRGYTGHEHLDQFALINMNGRLYDPVLGRMLSPDNFVQDASSTQGFNRYSYCNNNPLKYTDPSGYVYMYDYVKHDWVWSDNPDYDPNSSYSSGQFYDASFGGTGSVSLPKSSWAAVCNAYNNRFGLVNNNGVWGKWGVNISIFHELVAVSVNGGPSQNVWVAGVGLTPVFRPKVDDFKNVWNVSEPEKPFIEVSFNNGVIGIETNFIASDWGAVTPIPIVIYPKGGSSNAYYSTHEPGHVIQQFILGPAYYDLIAMPSLFTAGFFPDQHSNMAWEMSANQLWYWLTGQSSPGDNPLYFGPKK